MRWSRLCEWRRNNMVKALQVVEEEEVTWSRLYKWTRRNDMLKALQVEEEE